MKSLKVLMIAAMVAFGIHSANAQTAAPAKPVMQKQVPVKAEKKAKKTRKGHKKHPAKVVAVKK